MNTIQKFSPYKSIVDSFKYFVKIYDNHAIIFIAIPNPNFPDIEEKHYMTWILYASSYASMQEEIAEISNHYGRILTNKVNSKARYIRAEYRLATYTEEEAEKEIHYFRSKVMEKVKSPEIQALIVLLELTKMATYECFYSYLKCYHGNMKFIVWEPVTISTKMMIESVFNRHLNLKKVRSMLVILFPEK